MNINQRLWNECNIHPGLCSMILAISAAFGGTWCENVRWSPGGCAGSGRPPCSDRSLEREESLNGFDMLD